MIIFNKMPIQNCIKIAFHGSEKDKNFVNMVNAAFLLSNGRDILGRASVANAIIYSDRRQCCEAVTASSARRRLQ